MGWPLGKPRIIIENGEKPCVRCGVVYPLTIQYYKKSKNTLYGFRQFCRNCGNIERKKYRKNGNNRYSGNKARQSKARKMRMWELYGNMRCEICGDKPNKRLLSKDHDHKTGKIRGYLCLHCNSMLGYSRDSINNLSSAIEYLKKYKS